MGEITSLRRTRHDGPRGRVPDWSVTDADDVRKCLTVLAEEGGDTKRTVERCREEKLYPAAPWELAKWRDEDHPRMWVEIHSEHEKRLERIAEAKSRELAIRATTVAAKAVDRIDSKIGDADLVEAAKALDSLSKASSSHIDAVLKLSGRPVQGGPSGSLSDTLRELQRVAPQLFAQAVDGDAVEDAVEVDP